MGFYIIEINDKYKQVVLLSAEGELYCKDVAGLMPYTEPDLEQIRKEAYEKGRKYGKIEGRAEAWNAAKKIALHPEEGGIALGDIRKIFGCHHFQTVFRDCSASECIEKIRAYEQEKEEQIQVGDEVTPRETEYDDMIVTRLWKDDYDSDCIDAIGFDGRIGSFLVSRVSKTGEHYEIAEVLAKMKESDNG